MLKNSYFDCVGSTPLIQLSPGLYAKLETYNPTGSIKDRMISYVVKCAIRKNLIDSETILIEATSGNTGIALAACGASLGNPVKIIMPCNMSNERKQMMKAFGAEVIEVGHSDFTGAISMREDLLKSTENAWSPHQFENNENIECHKTTTAPEIHEQLAGKEWSAVVGGAGTGGTMMGIFEYCAEREDLDYDCVLVAPKEDSKTHGIQGINDGQDFLLDPSKMHSTIQISTEDAIARSQRIALETGLLVGISSGANVLAAEMWIKQNNPTGAVVTILCDRGERYLSTSS